MVLQTMILATAAIKQRGAALITALLLMTLVAAAATAIAVRQEISIKRTQQLLVTNQSFDYAQYVNDWAAEKLIDDWKKSKDGSMGSSSKVVDFFPIVFTKTINGYHIKGEILDAQALFNINSLTDKKNQEVFERLIENLDPEMDKKQIKQVTLAVAQWIASPSQLLALQSSSQVKDSIDSQDTDDADSDSTDSDSDADDNGDSKDDSDSTVGTAPPDDNKVKDSNQDSSTQNGNNDNDDAGDNGSDDKSSDDDKSGDDQQDTEKKAKGTWDNYYLKQKPPYSAPHRPMAKASEIRLVHGITQELYSKLAPYIVALPTNKAAINVNTAPELLLMAIGKKMTKTTAEFIIDDRADSPYTSVANFQKSSNLTNVVIDSSLISISSDYFLVKATITKDHQTLTLITLMQRTSGAGQTSDTTKSSDDDTDSSDNDDDSDSSDSNGSNDSNDSSDSNTSNQTDQGPLSSDSSNSTDSSNQTNGQDQENSLSDDTDSKTAGKQKATINVFWQSIN